MVREGRTLDPGVRRGAGADLSWCRSPARATTRSSDRSTTAAPLEIPHTLNLLLAEKSRKRNRRPGNIESLRFPRCWTPGLLPVTWPRNSDVRVAPAHARLKRTPVVGWLAENLYRSKKDDGWCVEADPGEGEYVLFYRFHPKRVMGTFLDS